MPSLLKKTPPKNDPRHFSISIPTQLSIATLLASTLITALANSTAYRSNFNVGVGSVEGALSSMLDSFRHLEFWVVILFPAVCVFVFSRILLQPLNEMVRISRKISQGHLDVRFEEDSNLSEFLELSQVANHMLEQLEIAFNQQQIAYQQQGRFIANAAHELRTPLTTMRSNLEAFQIGLEYPDPEFSNWVKRQEKSLNRLENLVEDLLLLAQQDNFEKSELVLGILLEEVIAEYEPLARQAEVSILLAGDAGIAVWGEERLLMQVFSNLLENAIRYNRAGGSVTIALSQTDKNAVIKFSDTGIGIAKEEQGLIFERFYRVDQSRVHNGSGAGLGLSIVTHILKYHSGTILVDSQLGTGTTFTVSLPKT